jgi:hypothetical protein
VATHWGIPIAILSGFLRFRGLDHEFLDYSVATNWSIQLWTNPFESNPAENPTISKTHIQITECTCAKL